MELEHRVPLRQTNWLDVPLARLVTLDRATLLLGLVLLLTVASRFWALGERALHHDESLHAVYSYYLYDQGRYIHEPLMHGPVLFHLNALAYWLFGATDATARLVPALLGVALAWLPWKFRAWLGMRGALAASALTLISPTALYFSRFLREDIYTIVWTTVIVYGIWKYLDEGKDFHLYVLGAGMGLLFSQKETSFLSSAIFWSFLLVIFGLRRAGRLGPKVPTSEMREWHLLVLIGALLLPFTAALLLHLPALLNEQFGLALPILDPGAVGGNSETSVYNNAAAWPTAFKLRGYALVAALFGLGTLAAARLWSGRKFLGVAAVFYTIFILLHTTFLTNPHGLGSGMIGALGYWIEQHEVQRGEQPWFYYAMLLPLYDFLPILLGLGGSALLLLRRRNGRVSPAPDAETTHLNARALWPWFNLWWFVGTLGILSYAGEKMPWLLIHIAFPLILLAGWAVGRWLDRSEWARLRLADALGFAALFGLVALAAAGLAWLSFHGMLPFQGSDEASLRTTARWVVGAVFLLGAGWAASAWGERLGRRAARDVAIVAISGLLALATVRFAILVAFVNSDTPNEPLIFVQTSPSVTRLMRDLDAISERIAGDRNLKVAYDNFSSWPFEWYLRDYPNRFFYGSEPQTYADAIRDAPVVIVGWENEQAVKPLVTGYVRHEYPMRWWFPEEYKNAMGRYIAEPDPADPTKTVLRFDPNAERSLANMATNIGLFLRQPEAMADFYDFVFNRQMENPLGGERFAVYIKPDVAAQVWGYGDAAPAETIIPADPYAAAAAPLPASAIVGQPGDFAAPKSVAVLPDGTLAVADSGNHRIRIVQPDGTLVREFGTFGAEPGQFNEPWGIAAAPDGTLYVADTWNHRVQHLSAEGEVLHVWGTFSDQPTTGGTFWGPRAVALDAQGNVYVTDTGNKQVEKFDATGRFLAQFGGAGAAPGQLAEPVGLAVAPDGTIWVADTWNQRIQGFAPDFTPLVQISLQTWTGQSVVNKPYLAASADRVWLSDPEAARVIEMDHTGRVIRAWGGFGSDALGLNLPFGLTWDGQRLWLADSGNNRVVGYDVGE